MEYGDQKRSGKPDTHNNLLTLVGGEMKECLRELPQSHERTRPSKIMRQSPPIPNSLSSAHYSPIGQPMRQPPRLFSVPLFLLGAIYPEEAHLHRPPLSSDHPQGVAVHDSDHMGGEGFGSWAASWASGGEIMERIESLYGTICRQEGRDGAGAGPPRSFRDGVHPMSMFKGVSCVLYTPVISGWCTPSIPDYAAEQNASRYVEKRAAA